MSWSVIKQTDSRYDNVFVIQTGSLNGACPNKYMVWSTPSNKIKVGFKRRGAMTAFLGHKTGGYRPNKFRITPAVHQSSSLTCEDTSVVFETQACLPNTKVFGTYKLRGPVALLPNVSAQLANAYPSYNYDVDESLVQKAMARSNEAQAAVLTSAVELPMTLALFIDPFKRLGDKLNGLSKPRTLKRLSKNNKNVLVEKRKFGESIDYAFEAWFQLRYGILPLMGEIDTYRKLYNSKLETPLGPIIKSRAGGGEPQWVHTDFAAAQSWLYGYYWGTVSKSEYVKRTVTVYSQRQWNLQSSLGLDLSGVLGAAWERIPYSFVLDWFINFGDWLKAIMPVSGVTHLGMSTSTQHVSEEVVEVKQIGQSAKGYRTSVSSVAKLKNSTYYRWTDHVPQLLPAASPYLGNIARMIDSVGLVYNRAAKRLPYR